MSGKPFLVEYRRTSSDMDMSTSDEEDMGGSNPPTSVPPQQPEQCPSEKPSASTSPRRKSVDSQEKDMEESDGSDKIVNNEDGDRNKDSRSRDSRQENGKRSDRRRDRKDRSQSPDRRKKRSRSRGRSPHHRHRSRSPRKRRSPSYHRHSPDRRDYKRSRSPDHRSRKYHRSSRSPDYRSRRLERKVARIDKLGLDLFPDGKPGYSAPGDGTTSSYINPAGATAAARLTEQIQKRKLLWTTKKEAQPVQEPAVVDGGKSWEAATFKGDNDGKMTEKFKRLMGIKGEGMPAGPSTAPDGNNSLIKKQEEMFSNMEAQYQVARMATHTHRGIGLGFGTFQVPPR